MIPLLQRYQKKVNRPPQTIWRNPIHFIACGFGFGTFPYFPGTIGTLIAIPLAIFLSHYPLWFYITACVALFCAPRALNHRAPPNGFVPASNWNLAEEPLSDGAAMPCAMEKTAAGVPVIAYGQFINVVINFLIVAMAVFLLVKAINIMRRKPAPAPEPTAQEKLLIEIRDLLRARA